MDKDTKLQWSQSSVKSVPFPEAGSNNGLRKYINAVYDATENARTSALEAAYRTNMENMKAAKEKAQSGYADTARQMASSAAQQKADYRQIAGAQGLNPNAAGQAALLQNNAAQTNMTKLGGSRAGVQAQIDMQRDLLERNRQYDMQRVLAENENERNKALYEEAVRMDNVRLQEQQFKQQQSNSMFQAKLNKAIAQKKVEAKAAAAAARGGSGGTPTRDDLLAEIYGDMGETGTPFIMDKDGTLWMWTEEGYVPYEGLIVRGKEMPFQPPAVEGSIPQGGGLPADVTPGVDFPLASGNPYLPTQYLYPTYLDE